MSDQKHLQVLLSEEDHRRLKLKSVEEDRPMTQIIRDLVEDYLEEEDE
jgi:predicted DNA-binding protein